MSRHRLVQRRPVRQRPVLCPDNISGSGFVYGWNTPLLHIAGILDVQTIADAQTKLIRIQESSEWDSLIEQCGSFPTVFGEAIDIPPGSTEAALSSPRLRLSHPDNDRLDDSDSHFTFVRYARPQFRHLEMYILNATSISTGPCSAALESPASLTRSTNLCLHDFTQPPVHKSVLLNERVVSQMNFGKAVEQVVMHSSSDTHIRGGSTQVSQMSSQSWESGPRVPSRTFLTRMSTLALQVATRFRQLQYLYKKFPPPSYRRTSMSADVISHYVGFYNCLWLIVNDIIIGIAVGSLFHENADLLSHFLTRCIQRFLIEDIQRTLLWLNNWPAGLKLNTELSNLYCHLLLSAMVIWNHVLTTFVLPRVNSLIYVAGIIGSCGVTMTAALLTDILSLFTVHMRLCYVLSLTVFANQLDAAGALWKLFRGKRLNVLRRRTDSWVFDVDQLLFGTILFTLLAFIYPTTMTYYVLFALLRLCTLAVYDILEILLMLINQFPLFALMLHLKDPFRLPEGLVLDFASDDTNVRVQNMTIPLSSIFGQYSYQISLLARRRHPLVLLRSIFGAKGLV